MQQKNKFWIALVAITIVCFIDYQFFTEGYSVRRISPLVRQVAHFIVLLAVIPIGWWAWKDHPMQWLKKLWLYPYITVLAFIAIVGVLKTTLDMFGEEFLDWVTTVRYLFNSPMPHVFLYMLSLIAAQRDK